MKLSLRPLAPTALFLLVGSAAACSAETTDPSSRVEPPPAAADPGAGSGAAGSTGSTPSAPSQSAPDPSGASAPTAPAPPAKKVLTFEWQGEQYDYWCGPSATRMALSTRLTSLPTQATLAQELPTSTDGTDNIGLVAKELNERLGKTLYEEVDLPDPPSAQQRAKLKADIVALIAAGNPMVTNVVSGWRPPTYPATGTIYHYVTVVGYDASGDKVLIADPAAEGHGGLSPAWNDVPKSYWITTQDLGTWIGGKGYTAPAGGS